jgi:hypothetical protein
MIVSSQGQKAHQNVLKEKLWLKCTDKNEVHQKITFAFRSAPVLRRATHSA